MIVGQQPRQGDLAVNVCRAKKLTNIRSSTSDIAVKLTPPVILSLEQSLDFLADDELLEVTPKAYRLRKRLLSQTTAPRSASAPRSRRDRRTEPEPESRVQSESQMYRSEAAARVGRCRFFAQSRLTGLRTPDSGL